MLSRLHMFMEFYGASDFDQNESERAILSFSFGGMRTNSSKKITMAPRLLALMFSSAYWRISSYMTLKECSRWSLPYLKHSHSFFLTWPIIVHYFTKVGALSPHLTSDFCRLLDDLYDKDDAVMLTVVLKDITRSLSDQSVLPTSHVRYHEPSSLICIASRYYKTRYQILEWARVVFGGLDPLGAVLDRIDPRCKRIIHGQLFGVSTLKYPNIMARII